MDTLLSAGEFAKLASTTKRTILFYDELGILKPVQVEPNGYRWYNQSQILDYQRILLLSALGVSLQEMKEYRENNGALTRLFDIKSDQIEKEIRLLQSNLQNLKKFQANLLSNGTMVNPEIKVVPPFSFYYIEKIGSYVNIGQYCEELLSMLSHKGRHPITLAMFEEEGYRPKKSRMKIGVIATKQMKPKKTLNNLVKFMGLRPGKVVTYAHHGSGSLLSLFWKELEKYCALNGLHARNDCLPFELYRRVDPDTTKQIFEIYLPIE